MPNYIAVVWKINLPSFLREVGFTGVVREDGWTTVLNKPKFRILAHPRNGLAGVAEPNKLTYLLKYISAFHKKHGISYIGKDGKFRVTAASSLLPHLMKPLGFVRRNAESKWVFGVKQKNLPEETMEGTAEALHPQQTAELLNFLFYKNKEDALHISTKSLYDFVGAVLTREYVGDLQALLSLDFSIVSYIDHTGLYMVTAEKIKSTSVEVKAKELAKAQRKLAFTKT